MRIALLSDVHANLHALRGALALASRLGADRLVVAGDLVGDGPNPLEVVRELRRSGAECVLGNVDREVIRLAGDAAEREEWLGQRGTQGSNRAWTALQLLAAEGDLDWLAALPPQRVMRLEGREALIVHGSPLGDRDYIYPSITAEALDGKLAPLGGRRPDLLVSGHSHIPFARTVGGVLVVNCGSVGRPADGDPRGTFALVDLDHSTPARLVRFRYPLEALIRDLRERAVPGIDPEQYRLGVKR